MQGKTQVGVLLKDIQIRQIAVLISFLEDRVEVADWLMIVKDEAESDRVGHEVVSVFGLFAALLMVVGGVYGLGALGYDYLPFLPLISLPEAIINGMLVAVFVVYRPNWVTSFDDAMYLKNTYND